MTTSRSSPRPVSRTVTWTCSTSPSSIRSPSDGTTTTASTVGPDDGVHVDYGDASAAFVAAAVNGADVTEVGVETIAGVSATRYELAITHSDGATPSTMFSNLNGDITITRPY